MTEYAGRYGEHFGDLSNILIPTYNAQSRDETRHTTVSIPIRETQLYPRTIPMAQADGGVAYVRHRDFEWRLPMRPGVAQRTVPNDNPLAPIIYGGEHDVLQPIDNDGNVDKMHLWPVGYNGKRIAVREAGL